MAKRRGRKWTFNKIMKTSTKNIPAADLYAVAYNLNKMANKRIDQVERAGYDVIKNQGRYFISTKTGRFADVQKGNSSDFYRRKINQLKNFMNSPGNDIKKIKKERSRLNKKFKGEKITEEDFKKYRKQAGRIWAKMDENEKLNGIGSERMETIIIRNIISFKSFNAQLKHINEEIQKEKERDRIKNDIFERKMRELNNQL